MIIEIYTKNNALAKTITNVSGPVPRFCQTFELRQDGGYLQGVTEAIVYDVSYILQNDELTPLIKCRPYYGPHTREDLIEQLGWKPETP